MHWWSYPQIVPPSYHYLPSWTTSCVKLCDTFSSPGLTLHTRPSWASFDVSSSSSVCTQLRNCGLSCQNCTRDSCVQNSTSTQLEVRVRNSGTMACCVTVLLKRSTGVRNRFFKIGTVLFWETPQVCPVLEDYSEPLQVNGRIGRLYLKPVSAWWMTRSYHKIKGNMF